MLIDSQGGGMLADIKKTKQYKEIITVEGYIFSGIL